MNKIDREIFVKASKKGLLGLGKTLSWQFKRDDYAYPELSGESGA